MTEEFHVFVVPTFPLSLYPLPANSPLFIHAVDSLHWQSPPHYLFPQSCTYISLTFIVIHSYTYLHSSISHLYTIPHPLNHFIIHWCYTQTSSPINSTHLSTPSWHTTFSYIAHYHCAYLAITSAILQQCVGYVLCIILEHTWKDTTATVRQIPKVPIEDGIR